MNHELKTFDFPYEVKELKEDGTFAGIGSPFGGAPDSGGDVIENGAFTETIKGGGPNGDGTRSFLWHHDPRTPIGIITSAKEIQHGLFVTGQYALDATMGKDAYALAKLGAARQLSIGYRVPEGGMVQERNVRRLKQIDWMELSQVTFGMAGVRARITNVKEDDNESISIKEAKTARELERALRDEGLSHAVAKQVVAMCRPALREVGKSEGGQFSDLLRVLQQQRVEAQSYRAVWIG